jgi:hypothetical protein
MPKTIHIKIIGKNEQSLCQVDCGNDWSQPDVQTKVKAQLRERFDRHVILEYLDVKDSYKQFQKETQFPILVINGYTRLTGQFDIRQLFDIVETQLELRTANR